MLRRKNESIFETKIHILGEFLKDEMKSIENCASFLTTLAKEG